MSRPPRVVLDTHLVLSALVFANGRLAALRHAWQGGKCVPIVSKATTAELIRVLAYPKFKLGDQDQLVSGDQDVLSLAEQFKCPIVTAEQFLKAIE